MFISRRPKPHGAQSAIFTIVSANYIGFAATLMQSVRTYHPAVKRFIILSDAPNEFAGIDLAAEVIGCDDLGIDCLDNMKLWYSVVEFNTAVKPFAFSHLFQAFDFSDIIYIDPDIRLYSPLDEVYEALVGHSIVLTPHMMQPLQDGKEPSDITIMKAGIYNFGFVAFKNDEDGRRLIGWWCDRLFAHCRIDVPGHMFTDQRWMDLAPVFVERPCILRHPGYNVAYWNIAHRTIARRENGDWTVNGLPLRFFHFSGIKPNDDKIFSKHQNRFTYENLGPATVLCTEYREAVLANSWYEFSKIEYAYGFFSDGRPISDSARRWVLRAVDDKRLAPKTKLNFDSSFFDAADEEISNDGRQLTRFAHQFWRDRPDLQQAFDIHDPAGFDGYVEWLCGAGGEAEGVHPLNVLAARCLRSGSQPDPVPAPAAKVHAPWTPVAHESWQGEARSVAIWLQEDIEFESEHQRVRLPKQAALLWERRADLQTHFPLECGREQVDAYLSWVLTEGLLTGAVAVDLLSTAFVREMATLSQISRYYNDVPITRALILTRKSLRARDGFSSWQRFPTEKQARSEHGFWFCYVAPALFGWPKELYGEIQAYFNQPTGLTIDGFSITRGMLVPWENRGDLQRTFSLTDARSSWQYLLWLVFHAPTELNVSIVELCPGIAAFLSSESAQYPGISRLLELVYDERQDLQLVFDISTPDGLAALRAWSPAYLEKYIVDVNLAELLDRPDHAVTAKPSKVHRARIALTGHWEAASGLGEDLRSSASALNACGFTDFVIVNLDSRNMLTHEGIPISNIARLEVDWNIVHRNAETSLDDWQTMQRMGISAQKIVGHWHWELSRLPPNWIHAFSFYDEIWASSRFAMAAFTADARRPVRLLHGAVTAPVANTDISRQQLGVSSSATLFFFMFDFTSYAVRKNPHAVIRAFREAFPTGKEDAQLYIKTQNGANNPALWSELTTLADDKRIIIKDQKLSREELVGLLVTADAFVSLHRSEGYGRAPAEAMLLGRPVILTGYSGTTDFTDPECACIVDFTPVPVKTDEYPGVAGQSWAEADTAQAARYMVWVHENPEDARRMGERGRRKVADMLAPQKVGAKMVLLFDDVAAPSDKDVPKPLTKKTKPAVHAKPRDGTGSEPAWSSPTQPIPHHPTPASVQAAAVLQKSR